MGAECPNCRRDISPTRTFRTTLWGTWRCEGCSSLLGIDKTRRLLGVLVCAVAPLLFMKIVGMTASAGIALAAFLTLCILFVLLLDRAVVVEAGEFRCSQCGYDLQGQAEPRCPECGRNLQPQELESLHRVQAGDVKEPTRPARPWAGMTVIIILFVVLLSTMLLGIYVNRKTTAGRAAPAATPRMPVPSHP